MVRGNKFKPDGKNSVDRTAQLAAADVTVGVRLGSSSAAIHTEHVGREGDASHLSQRAGRQRDRRARSIEPRSSLQQTAEPSREAPTQNRRHQHSTGPLNRRTIAESDSSVQNTAPSAQTGATPGVSKPQPSNGKRRRVHAFVAAAPLSVVSTDAQAAAVSNARHPPGHGIQQPKSAQKNRQRNAGAEHLSAAQPVTMAQATVPHTVRQTDGQPQRPHKKRRRGSGANATAATVTINGVAVHTTIAPPAKGEMRACDSTHISTLCAMEGVCSRYGEATAACHVDEDRML